MNLLNLLKEERPNFRLHCILFFLYAVLFVLFSVELGRFRNNSLNLSHQIELSWK